MGKVGKSQNPVKIDISPKAERLLEIANDRAVIVSR